MSDDGLIRAPHPMVSVLLPVFNAEIYLQDAIRSILVQSERNFELLIIDDGSTDASAKIAAAAAAADKRVKVRSRANRGLVETLNELISWSRGELLARMDADDISAPERFALQLRWMNDHADCVALGTGAMFVDSDNEALLAFVNPTTHDEIESALLEPRIGILHPTVMLRAAAVRSVGGYRTDFPHVEDLDLFLRLGEVGALANLPDILMRYRLHPRSVSHAHTAAQIDAGRAAVRVARSRRGLPHSDSAGPVERETTSDLHRKWGWWALGSGFRGAAFKHCRKALRARIVDTRNWHLALSIVKSLGRRRRLP